MIAQVKTWGKEGELIADEATMGGPGDLDGGNAPVDTDGDGIPDDVEKELGTDPNKHDSMELDSSGYAYVEVWANSLVESSYHD